jgi:hypothetical protein
MKLETIIIIGEGAYEYTYFQTPRRPHTHILPNASYVVIVRFGSNLSPKKLNVPPKRERRGIYEGNLKSEELLLLPSEVVMPR